MRAVLVTFVGGHADGLRDEIPLGEDGQLPPMVETLGSVYRLVSFGTGDPEYHHVAQQPTGR